MEVDHYLRVLLRRWWVVAFCTLLGGLGSAAMVWGDSPQYRATSTVFFSLSRSNSVSELGQGSNYTRGLMQSYAEVVASPVVLDPVIEELGLDTNSRRLERQLDVQTPLESVLMTVSVNDRTAQGAAAISNAVAQQIPLAVDQLSPVADGGARPLSVTTIEPANPPSAPIGPRKTRAVAIGLALGLLLGCALVVLREVSQRRVRGAEDLRRATALPVLATIETPKGSSQVFPVGPRDAAAYKRLRSLLFAGPEGLLTGSLVLTGPDEPRASSAATRGLVECLAAAGATVLVVDTATTAHGLDGLIHPPVGKSLADVLRGSLPWRRALQQVPAWPGVDVLSMSDTDLAGTAFVGRTMSALLHEAREAYDVVVVHAPALLEEPDAIGLAAAVDVTLLVAVSGRTGRRDVATALASLADMHARVDGVVLARPVRHRPVATEAQADASTGAPAPEHARS